jgi:hypothetical protein
VCLADQVEGANSWRLVQDTNQDTPNTLETLKSRQRLGEGRGRLTNFSTSCQSSPTASASGRHVCSRIRIYCPATRSTLASVQSEPRRLATNLSYRLRQALGVFEGKWSFWILPQPWDWARAWSRTSSSCVDHGPEGLLVLLLCLPWPGIAGVPGDRGIVRSAGGIRDVNPPVGGGCIDVAFCCCHACW